MSDLSVKELLRLNLSDHWFRLRKDLLVRLEQEFKQASFNTNELEGVDKEYLTLMQLARFMMERIGLWLDDIDERHSRFNEFRHNYQSSVKAEEARSHLLNIADSLGYTRRARRKITKGRAKWLDESAVYDRHVQKIAAIEQDISVTLQRLADLVMFLIGFVEPQAVSRLWRLLSLHTHLLRPLDYQANSHVRIAAFHCLGQSLKVLRTLPTDISHRIPANIHQYVYRTCLDDQNNLWLRSEAITLVSQLNPEQFLSVLGKIFVSQPDSDPYLRGRVVHLMCEYDQPHQAIDAAVAHIEQDPSDYVRQQLALKCIGWGSKRAVDILARIIAQDPGAKVRAQAYLSLKEAMDSQEVGTVVADIQLAALDGEQDDFALRTLMHTLPQCALLHEPEYGAKVMAVLLGSQQNHPSTKVRGWAAQCREHLWFISRRDILDGRTQQKISQLPFQRSCTVAVPVGTDKDELNRFIGHLGRQRYGFDIIDKGNKLKLRAGYKFGFRFWRFWHEFINTATDKRQNHDHLKGRLYYGMVQTGAETMAELSVTKVPGEPLFISAEGGWRDYLPLLDQVLSSLDQGWPTKPVKVYSAQGVTHILPPSNLLRRLYARSYIQLKFAHLAGLRNYKDDGSGQPDQYINALKKLGFSIWIEGYLDDPLNANGSKNQPNSKVQRFFSALPLPFALPSLTEMQNYFYSVYQNNIMQLIGFSLVASAGFLGAHIRKLLQMRSYRKKIPLVVGGWGTRGKSGTERLKAALFNAMGLSVVSKTTGCEAMFLYGPANRPMKEMFLFRPYDKASIWEQVFITGLSSKLKADVFLWECMGLTPRYIDIIQNQWMKDDLATITNCYPDHEDLQGPAGIEIPIVMQRFVPYKSHLLTSEESMLPLLEDAAREKKTEMTPVTWLEAGLLTDDVVGRFPYEEHPNNIALVAKLAEALDIETDFALKEMADNVVADLGVLKIYPVAEVQGRRLSFINGMSANERLGAMGNWQRTGLSSHTLENEPDVWLGVVVNNRSDRIARSKVFAAMLVNDMQADCYMFIGNNLTGLQSYIDEAWQAFAAGFTLDGKNIEQLAAKFRIPVSWQQVLGRLKGCLAQRQVEVDSWPEAEQPEQWQLPELEGIEREAILKRFKADLEDFRQYCRTKEQLVGGQMTSEKALDWVCQVFKSKWVVVEDYYSSGNQTIDIMLQNTPPGLTARLIGVQNIKGTGLDFIYRWQAWDVVHKHCETLCHSRDELALEEASKALTTWEEFGLLDKAKVQQSLAIAKERPEAQKELLQGEFRLIEQRLDKQLEAIEKTLGGEQAKSKGWSNVLTALEAFLDAGDAVKRRKVADEIYQDLLDGLISYDKASVELAKLTKAQKGGWLEQRLRDRFA